MTLPDTFINLFIEKFYLFKASISFATNQISWLISYEDTVSAKNRKFWKLNGPVDYFFSVPKYVLCLYHTLLFLMLHFNVLYIRRWPYCAYLRINFIKV